MVTSKAEKLKTGLFDYFCQNHGVIFRKDGKKRRSLRTQSEFAQELAISHAHTRFKDRS